MIIEFKEVTIGYEKVHILENINLDFCAGKLYCILGPNGIGKTTLFKTLLGFIPIISGTITIDGKQLKAISTSELSEYISYVPQAKDMVYDLSVLDVVVMGRARFIKKFATPSTDDYSAARSVLESLAIDRLSSKKYSELSGGEQQIVLIARALAQESKFIVMDEPASNLDFENQSKVLSCLKQLSGKGIGVILTSHSPDHAIFCNTEVILIDKKKNIKHGLLNDMITSENLKAVYGVDVRIFSEETKDGKTIKSCCLVN